MRWFEDATSEVALVWRRERLAPLSATLHPGTCDAPGPALLGLRTLTQGATSIATPVPISGNSLQLGGFVVVVRDPDGAVVGCADLRP